MSTTREEKKGPQERLACFFSLRCIFSRLAGGPGPGPQGRGPVPFARGPGLGPGARDPGPGPGMPRAPGPEPGPRGGRSFSGSLSRRGGGRETGGLVFGRAGFKKPETTMFGPGLGALWRRPGARARGSVLGPGPRGPRPGSRGPGPEGWDPRPGPQARDPGPGPGAHAAPGPRSGARARGLGSGVQRPDRTDRPGRALR